MITLLSPAKSLDLSEVERDLPHTQPAFMTHTRKLVKRARELGPRDLQELMGISEKLALLNVERFESFKSPLEPGAAKQAALAFAGDVYRGLEAATLSREDLEYAQDHVRILSGLYGMLRPLDLMHPYRLEMGTCLETERGGSLYEFWGDRLARALMKELKEHDAPVVVNLASNEYFKAAGTGALKARVITPVFKEVKDGKPKVISFVAKHSRGLMTRWMIENRVDDPEALKDFRMGGYRFQRKASDEDTLIFQRKHRTKAKAA